MMTTKRLGIPVLLCAALLLGSCGMRGILPEGAELIPADATFAISVDVKAILESRLYKMYEQNESVFGRNRLNFYRFAEATGLNPATDIKRLLFMARADDEGLADMSGLAVGTFDGRKVHDYLVGSGLPSHKVEGMDIFEFIVIGDKCRFCLAVVDASTAAFGDGETLEKIARIHAGQAPNLAEQEGPGRLIRRVGRGAEAWGIVRAADFKDALTNGLKQLSADTSALSALGPIQEVAFSFDTEEPMRVLIEATTSTEQDALLVADVLKGAESMARLTLRETKPEVAMLMSDLQIGADTGVVRVAGSLPASDVETLTRLAGVPWLRGVAPATPSP